MKETAVVFITLLLLLTIISIFGGAMKPAQAQAPQNHHSFLLNAHEGYENAANAATGPPPQYGAGASSQMPHGGDDGGAYPEAHVENIQEDEDDDNGAADTGVMPFVSEEFASF